MTQKLIVMPPRTYNAKLIQVPWCGNMFQVAGTLDGYIDLATPNGTYVLAPFEASLLAIALRESIVDVNKNCLHNADPLLEK